MPTDHFIELAHLRMHLLDWGGPTDALALLLIHGLASNAKIWNFVAAELAKTFRVVALDQRSHGLTSAPAEGDFSFANVCGDMRAVGQQLGFERPLVVGHSWGGSVALEYALRYPENVAGLVMVDGGFVGLNKRMTWPEAAERLAPPRLAGTPLADFQERAKDFLGELHRAEVLDIVMGNFEVRADQTIAPHLAFDNHLKIVRAMWEQDADWLYAQVKCPALYLPCRPLEPHSPMDQQFLAWKRESVAHIQRLMPQAQIQWLTDSIHDVPLQRPELVADKVRAFAHSLA